MASFVVMQPPAGQRAERAEAIRFVRDGFSIPAFLVPFVWLLWYRLWIEAAFALAAALLIALAGEAAGFGPGAGLWSLLVSLYVGLEGPALRLAAMRRRGWRDAAIIEAESLEDAEIRYYAHGEDEAEASQPTPQAIQIVPAAGSPRASAGPALGLLSYPGRS